MMHPRAAELVATLDLRPHPEGGFYREVFRSRDAVAPADGRGPRAALTSIYFLLAGGSISRWHQVTSDESWHFYEGSPLELLELDLDGGALHRQQLGPVIGDAQAPAYTIAAGRWQAARPLGDYSLVGCSVGPGFDFADFRLLAEDRDRATAVRAAWPDLAGFI